MTRGARLLAETGGNLDNTSPGAPRACAVTSRNLMGETEQKRMAIDLVNVAAGAGGFVIHGQDAGDHCRDYSVSSAGDVNGDGFDDVIIGAPTR